MMSEADKHGALVVGSDTLSEISRLQQLAAQLFTALEQYKRANEAHLAVSRFLYERVPRLYSHALADAELQGFDVSDLEAPRVPKRNIPRKAQ